MELARHQRQGRDNGAPGLGLVALNGRTVYVAFDSDVTVKVEVREALARLKAFLESRKAKVEIVYLPAADGGAKMGLDDYLAAGHTVDELLALARPELLARIDTSHSANVYTGPPIDLGSLLTDVGAVYRRYVVMAQEQADALALHQRTHTS